MKSDEFVSEKGNSDEFYIARPQQSTVYVYFSDITVALLPEHYAASPRIS